MTAPERYAFVSLAGGGLLLDLESGGLFQLNATAAFVWRRFLEGADTDAIASALAERHGIDASRARADVVAALQPEAPSDSPAPEDYQFHRSATGYVQFNRDQPELEIDETGAMLAVAMPASQRRPRRLGNSVRAIVPKILSLRGHTVIHASAVVVQGRLLAFSGRSGAGKTTTARALVERGATLVSEDKLLVRTDGESTVAWRDAEAYIDTWVMQATITLLADGRISCAALDEAAHGEQLPIAELGFLDVAPRHGDQLVARRLGLQEAASASFRGMFLGTALPSRWRRQLEAAAALAERVPGYAVTMPEGLRALGHAAEALARCGTLAV